MSSKPSWMDAPAAGGGDVESASRASGSAVATGEGPPYAKTVHFIFFLMNAGLMVFLAATGALGIGSSTSINDTGLIFVGLYLIIFAGLVFFYEISQVLKWERFDEFMKRNFGFLYGVNGKSLFIIMVGVMAFGLSKPRPLAIACGVVLAAWGVAQILIYMKFPEYFEVKEKYQP